MLSVRILFPFIQNSHCHPHRCHEPRPNKQSNFCQRFLSHDGLLLGAISGAIAWVNVEEDGMPVELFHLQSSSIRRLAHTRDGIGSSGSNYSPWKAVAEDFVSHVSEARYAEFSNTGLQDRLVATYGKMAKVFDLTTGTRFADLFSAFEQSGYALNKATFSHLINLFLTMV
ncbi:Protein vprbp [Fasciolopsis buskii]|uniref:Protein vprbp n=1 Tax=Fasciolopsis buskii TaxID=27845 RepID=A0A8E0RYP6_9TREM|nr:Protein vprbp [Fasciolopsis buski]